MGTKIKQGIYLLIVLLIYSKTIAQNKVAEIKKYAFNKCISYNYQKIDSTFYKNYKDASGVQISVNGNFIEDDILKNKIIDFTINVTGLYYSLQNNLHFETGDKNIIFCNCFDFYESAELEKFIKKLLKK
ncbi:hypothetical protein IRZ71_07400 [Flavobacterium sp. ANB]|uniref:hypothetical protein n=1 Tax=unclassified Flavobacterium TaxID=196869 RepID=UPI0012B8969B|nr:MULTISPECIES: hypothetical protein [unclassified Flavobacterium]MBF4516160.1 hypothetical protein [Flavobacterium sp. ANB]MTD69943.1 hypothetical protein [Flavobacterium sp. LC2016-13]